MNLHDFFNEYMIGYSRPDDKNAYKAFLEFLRDTNFLCKNSKRIHKPTQKYIKEGFFSAQKGVVVKGREECLKDQIIKKIKDKGLLTYDQLLSKSGLKKEIFQKTLECEKIWIPNTKTYRKKCRYVKYSLFTKDAFNLIKLKAGELESIVDVYFIQWIGPFYSVDSCKTWELEHSIADYEFNFYYGRGKKRNGRKFCYYIGKSEMKNVNERISQSSDPVSKDFRKNAEVEIWIGRFSNPDLRRKKTDDDVVKKEKHERVEHVEWELISGFKESNSNEVLLNEKKLTAPKQTCLIINQWYKSDDMSRYKRGVGSMKEMPAMFFYYEKGKVKVRKQI